MDPLVAFSRVNVRYKPEIVEIYVLLGEDFILSCSYTADSAVTVPVLWYKNGQVLDYRRGKMRELMPYGSVIEITGGEGVRLNLAAGLLM